MDQCVEGVPDEEDAGFRAAACGEAAQGDTVGCAEDGEGGE